uniref:protein-serine/threonine phosphatase n=1 Tax=Aegilops tauschii TaxID=37682 RepID=M8BPI9_AEGTA
MGICASSEHLGQQGQEADESIVYVMDEEGGGGASSPRKVASLFSQKGKKGPNQDAVILCQGFGMEDGVFCGVFDGHGRCGHLMLEEWREACSNAFKAMDNELKLQANMDCAFSGTTAVCAIKQGKDLIIANLGDSRAVLATMSGAGYLKAVQLTTDQKPGLPEEAERIKRCEGRVFALREEPGVMRVWLPGENLPGLAMARALGDSRLKHHGVISTPQVTAHRISDADLFIILATDGVWDVLSNEEVVSIVCATPRKQHASKAVVEAAVQRWKTKYPSSRVDDCSAVCLFLHDHTAAAPTKL